MATSKPFQKTKTEVIYTETVRHIDCVFDHSIGRTRQTFTELVLLREFENHDNIVKLYDVILWADDPKTFERLELTFVCSNYYLSDLLSSNQYFNNFNIKYILFQIINTIQYIHSLQIIHRNLNTHNILIDRYSFIQLSDFRKAVRFNESFPFHNKRQYSKMLSRKYFHPYTHYSRWYQSPEILVEKMHTRDEDHTSIEEFCFSYMAPELLLSIGGKLEFSDSTSPSLDIWSIGTVFTELLQMKKDIQPNYRRRAPMFAIKSVRTTDGISIDISSIMSEKESKLKNMYNTLGTYNTEINLLNKILVFDRKKRIDITELIQHSYFDEVRECFDDSIIYKNSNENKYLNWNSNAYNKVKTCRELILEQVLYYNQHDRIKFLEAMPFMECATRIDGFCLCYIPNLFIIDGIKQLIHMYLYQRPEQKTLSKKQRRMQLLRKKRHRKNYNIKLYFC